MICPVLDSANASTAATFRGSTLQGDLNGIPLGLDGAELGAKVIILNAGDIGAPTPPVGGFAIETGGNLASILAKLPTVGTASAPGTNIVSTQLPAITEIRSTALEASHVLKSSAGQLRQLAVFNSKASAQFILIMNATSLPGDGAVTLLYPPIPVAAATLVVLDFAAPLVASTGITVCNSSTGTFSKTIGSADCAFYAQIN